MINRNKKKFFIVGILLFVTIGFAYLSATLGINGLVGYKTSSWDVHFENIDLISNIDGTSLPVINSQKNQIDFSLSFSEPGEKYEFSVEVVNAGTINAMLSEIVKSEIDSDVKEYLNYTVTYYNGDKINLNDGLRAKAKVKLKISVIYKYEVNELVPEKEESFSLSLKYIRATDKANYINNYYEDNNNVFVLDDVKENSLTNLKIYGNSIQNSYTGKNLYNYMDVPKDGVALGSFTTPLTDGWVKIECHNEDGSQSNSAQSDTAYSNYYTNNLDLELNKKYYIVVEIKEVSGTGEFMPISRNAGTGQFGSSVYSLADLHSGDILIISGTAQESIKWGLRTYGKFDHGTDGSITFRLSVIDGDSEVTKDNFKYEPYVGKKPSPSYNYPQDINSVNGDINILTRSKNLFDLSTAEVGMLYIKTGELDNDNVSWMSSDFMRVQEENVYTLSWTSDSNYFQAHVIFYDKNKVYISAESIQNWDKYNSINSPKGAYYARISYSVKVSGKDVKRENIQFELGDKKTNYVSYKEKRITLSLNNIQLNKLGNFQDYIYNKNGKWFVHREIGIVNISSLTQYQTTLGDGIYRWKYKIANALQTDLSSNVAYCNIATLIDSNETDEGFTIDYSGDALFFFDDWKNKTQDEMNSWVSTNSIYVYYPLKQAVEEEIKDTTLVNQLNSFLNNNLLTGYNYVMFDASVPTNIKFNYTKF